MSRILKAAGGNVSMAARLAKIAGRPIRIEIEPGRYSVAGAGLLVARVKDIKETSANAKGPGHRFLMVDAGFNGGHVAGLIARRAAQARLSSTSPTVAGPSGETHDS